MMRNSRLLAVLFVGGAFLVVRPQAAPSVVADTAISGGGTVTATDDFGGVFPNAGQFTISAGLRPDGSPYGHLDLVGKGDFAAAWGACPYDARCENFPNTSTKTFHLSGEVHTLTTSGSEVVAAGLLSETDYGQGDGVIFHESDAQFMVIATEGSLSVEFQFCFVPPFILEVTRGHLSVSASTLATLFQRPAGSWTSGHALPCQAPVPAH